MGLASALTTALTGLTAAETQIDVLGNNLANSQTVGFKASNTVFATQLLQTQGLGSSPTPSNGGTNPRQTGLGVKVAEITPDFTQGTVEVSSNPSDLAIQGDGFFIVEGQTGEALYTRNGIFKTNSENQLVTVSGNRLLGHTVDELFTLQETELQPLTIPLGQRSVAQRTQNVFFEGTLTPTGDVADTAQVVESTVLGDGSVPRPESSSVTVGIASPPNVNSSLLSDIDGAGGSLAEGSTYQYRFAFVDSFGGESKPSPVLSRTVPAGNGFDDNSIQIDNLPVPTGALGYNQLRIYRTDADADDFKLITSVTTSNLGGPTTFTDTGIAGTTPLDDTTLTGNYNYLITYHLDGQPESRPSALIVPGSVVDGRVRIDNFPPPPVPGPGDDFPAYNRVRIYRNSVADSSSYFMVGEVDPGDSFTDSVSDTALVLNQQIDLDGPKATPSTLLKDITVRDELNYENVFAEGLLSFAARKGGRGVGEKSMEITDSSTVQDFIDFIEESSGIQSPADDIASPIPGSVNTIIGVGEPTELTSGATIQADGRIRVVSNNGVDNAVEIGLSAFNVVEADGSIGTPSLSFSTLQEAVGQSTVADFLVFDTLGTPITVRVTSVLEERTGSQTIYRWFADSASNEPLVGSEIAVGTGRVIFDGEGNFVSAANNVASVDRRQSPSASPLEFALNFEEVSGLAVDDASLAATRQDGSAPGTLSSFTIGENGIIRGVFDNGIARDLGRVQMARFTNPAGLEQRGDNLYGAGANSGLAVESTPGENGVGTLIAGAVELSNTDIGQNLVDLVLATTQYRGNTRVITASQQLIDELLNLRR